jgi:predicted Zn-dependent protease with MMP-like domain
MQACRPRADPGMPRKRWFFGGRTSLRDRVVNGLRQARDGDADDATGTIGERFPEALDELRRLGESHDAAWLQLAARLAFRTGDMAMAADLAEQALASADDAATWHLLGRVRTWLSRKDATAAFQRAAALEPDSFVIPVRVSHDRFSRLAERALAEVPDRFQAQMTNTMIVVDDLPDIESVREGEDPDLLGLYEGATVLEHGLPERIVLYQRNHENISDTERQLARQVRETMRHEIGHHFGMAEDELPY